MWFECARRREDAELREAMREFAQVKPVNRQLVEKDMFGSNFPSIGRFKEYPPLCWVFRIDGLQDLQKKCESIRPTLNLAFDAPKGFGYSDASHLGSEVLVSEAFARQQSARGARGQTRPGRVDVAHSKVP